MLHLRWKICPIQGIEQVLSFILEVGVNLRVCSRRYVDCFMLTCVDILNFNRTGFEAFILKEAHCSLNTTGWALWLHCCCLLYWDQDLEEPWLFSLRPVFGLAITFACIFVVLIYACTRTCMACVHTHSHSATVQLLLGAVRTSYWLILD